MQNDGGLVRPRPDPAHDAESTIRDLAATYGVSLRTLRFYEDKGLLHPRRQGTSRYYSAGDRIRLKLILKGKRLGFTLSEINALIASHSRTEPQGEIVDLPVSLDCNQIASQIALLERQRDDLNAAIDELRQAYLRMLEPTS